MTLGQSDLWLFSSDKVQILVILTNIVLGAYCTI